MQDDRDRILAILFGQVAGFDPVPVEASQVRKGTTDLDVVTLEWHDETFIYSLDCGTHLPCELVIVRHGTSEVGATKDCRAQTKPFTSETVIGMSEYREVGGIKTPSRIKIRDSQYRADLEVNVRVAEKLFSQPPPNSAGADSWK